MRVLVTGATGFVGRALVAALLKRHQVTAWVRDPVRARELLGADVAFASDAKDGSGLPAAVAEADAIVNLAGAPVDARWTDNYKKELTASRVGLTDRIATALAEKRGGVLVSASAVGYYGADRGDETLTEASAPGRGFLAELTQSWEAAACRGEATGTRVVRARFGMVLGHGGGALAKLAPLFRAGLGGPVGGGKQWVSWIWLDDLVRGLVRAVEDERMSGAYDFTAPSPVTNSSLAKSLGAALDKPSFLPAPGFAVKVAMGEASEIVLGGQKVLPERLLAEGFQFEASDLDGAFRRLFADQPAIGPITGALPSSKYLDERPPRRLLEHEILLDAPIEEVFGFFARPHNLSLLSPADVGLKFTNGVPNALEAGAIVEHDLRVGGIDLHWRTKIEEWVKNERFVDSEQVGPYASWWHEHSYVAEGARTRMKDRVWFAVPLEPLGAAARALFVEPKLRDIFAFRAQMVRMRFGAAPSVERA